MRDFIDRMAHAALFRARLTEALERTGMSRAALARAVDLDRSTVSQILGAEDPRMPGAHAVAAMAHVLRVSSDWLLGLSDRPEPAGTLLDATLSVTEAERSMIDAQVSEWHLASAGYKIRHVPATLPDMLKTPAVHQWEFAAQADRTAAPAIDAAEARLEFMRRSESDYEIAMPLHEIESFARGEGYYRGVPSAVRAEQLDWISAVFDELYPTLRLFFFDARRVFSAPLTVFGPRMAVLYLGRNFLAFRERERVRAITRHFDWLIREGLPPGQDPGRTLSDLRGAL